MISSFKTVAEKIIKTDEVLAIVNEKNKKLRKANNKIKILKEKNVELQKLKSDYDKLQNNLYSWIDKYTELEKKYNELNVQKNHIDDLVEKKVKVIKSLESKLELLQVKLENEIPKYPPPAEQQILEEEIFGNVTKTVMESNENKKKLIISSTINNELPSLYSNGVVETNSCVELKQNHQLEINENNIIGKATSCQILNTSTSSLPCLDDIDQSETKNTENSSNVYESFPPKNSSQQYVDCTKLSGRKSTKYKYILKVRINVINFLLKKINSATNGIKYLKQEKMHKMVRSSNMNIKKEIFSFHKTRPYVIDKFLRKLSKKIIFLVKYVRYIRHKQFSQKRLKIKLYNWSNKLKCIKTEENSCSGVFNSLFEDEITEQNLGEILEEMINYPTIISPMSAVSELSNINSTLSTYTNNLAIKEINYKDSDTQTIEMNNKQIACVQTEKFTCHTESQTLLKIFNEIGIQTDNENLNLKTNQKLNNLIKESKRQKLIFLRKLKILRQKLADERSLNTSLKILQSSNLVNGTADNVPLCNNHNNCCLTKKCCCGNHSDYNCSMLCSKLFQLCYHFRNNLHCTCYLASQRNYQNSTLSSNSSNSFVVCDCNCKKEKADDVLESQNDCTINNVTINSKYRHIAVQTDDMKILSENLNNLIRNKLINNDGAVDKSSKFTKTGLLKRCFGSDTESSDNESLVPLKSSRTLSSNEDSNNKIIKNNAEAQIVQANNNIKNTNLKTKKEIKSYKGVGILTRQKVKILNEFNLKDNKNCNLVHVDTLTTNIPNNILNRENNVLERNAVNKECNLNETQIIKNAFINTSSKFKEKNIDKKSEYSTNELQDKIKLTRPFTNKINVISRQKAISAIKKPLVKKSGKCIKMWGRGKQTGNNISNESEQNDGVVQNENSINEKLNITETVEKQLYKIVTNKQNLDDQDIELVENNQECTTIDLSKEPNLNESNKLVKNENLADNQVAEFSKNNKECTIDLSKEPNLNKSNKIVKNENLAANQDAELSKNNKECTIDLSKEPNLNESNKIVKNENLASDQDAEFSKNNKECAIDLSKEVNDNIEIDEMVVSNRNKKSSKSGSTKLKNNSVTLNCLLKDFINGEFIDENLINAVEKISNFNKNLFIRSLVSVICNDECSVLSLDYTPPAPPLTVTQQKIVALIGYIEKEKKINNVQTLFLKELRKEIINSGNDVQSVDRCTRLFIAICKLRRDIVKPRLLLCNVIYKHYFKALTIAYTMLTCWPEILPYFNEENDDILIEVIVHSLLWNNCKLRGYNKRPLMEMLQQFYNYKQIKSPNQLATILVQRFKETNDANVAYAIFLYCAHQSDENIFKIGKMLLEIIDEYEKKIRLKQFNNSNKTECEYLTLRTLNLLQQLVYKHKWSDKGFLMKDISKSFYDLNLACGGVLAGQELNLNKAFGKYQFQQKV